MKSMSFLTFVLLSLIVALPVGCGKSGKKKAQGARKADKTTMKGLGEALLSFHDTHRRFPFAFPKERHESLSWRVSLLPFLMEKNRVSLYDAIKKDKPASDPANTALANDNPDLYRLSNGSLVSSIKLEKPLANMADLIDGVSNTIAFIENPKATSGWMNSNDLTVDEAVKLVREIKPKQELLAVLYDGQVLSIGNLDEKKVTDDQLRGLFDPRDQKPFGPSILR